jgi:hypothetical protein
MLLPSLIAVLVLLAPVAYVAWRKLSLVEQEITFDAPQRGVAGVSVLIQDDAIQKLRIVYDDGQICEVFPAAAERNRLPARGQRSDPSPSAHLAPSVVSARADLWPGRP